MLNITFNCHVYRSTDATVERSAYTLQWKGNFRWFIRLVT